MFCQIVMKPRIVVPKIYIKGTESVLPFASERSQCLKDLRDLVLMGSSVLAFGENIKSGSSKGL